MRETWYVLEDGSLLDPVEATVIDGKLANSDGVAVAMRGNAYSSRGVDAGLERAKAPAKAIVAAKDIKPETPKRGYKTREVAAE